MLRQAFHSICAFLNSKGGTVIIGVNNNGKIIGQEIAHLVSEIKPPAQSSITINYIPIDSYKKVIIIDVNPGNYKPYVLDGKPYNRIQSTTSKMQQSRYEQLIIERSQLNHSWESVIASNYQISDLDHELIHNIQQRLEHDIPTNDLYDILAKLHLLIDGNLTRAAVILFCKNESQQFIQSQLRLARFNRDYSIIGGAINIAIYDEAMRRQR